MLLKKFVVRSWIVRFGELLESNMQEETAGWEPHRDCTDEWR